MVLRSCIYWPLSCKVLKYKCSVTSALIASKVEGFLMVMNRLPRLHSVWCGFCSLSLTLLSEFIICNLKAFLSRFIFRSPLARMILSWARAFVISALWDHRNLLKFLFVKIFFPWELRITVYCLPMGSLSKLDSVKGDLTVPQFPLRLYSTLT